jgi:hypothetical protein
MPNSTAQLSMTRSLVKGGSGVYEFCQYSSFVLHRYQNAALWEAIKLLSF